MTNDDVDTNRVMERLLADVVAPLGERARTEALTRADGIAANARALMQSLDTGDG